MITNTGKQIIAKYLMGTTPSYASYIAVGCGPKPLSLTDTIPDYSTKQVLDFEMFRVPILSRGYINDGGVNKVVLTAELPTEERYEISEVGIFSAGANPSAASYDSKTISAFADTENWQLNSGGNYYGPGTTKFESISGNLVDPSDNITSTAEAIQTYSSNIAFAQTPAGNPRANRYERCRYLNNIIMVRGNTSNITVSGSTFSVASSPKYLQLSGQTVDLSRNSTADLLKVAFSVISVTGSDTAGPDNVSVIVEFSNGLNLTDPALQYARMEVNAVNGSGGINFSTSRYIVAEKRLDELTFTSDFSWNNVNTIRVFACSKEAGVVTADYFIALDAIRMDNIATINPLYGLVGYSIVQTDGAETIVKASNTNNYVEFRFILDVT